MNISFPLARPSVYRTHSRLFAKITGRARCGRDIGTIHRYDVPRFHFADCPLGHRTGGAARTFIWLLQFDRLGRDARIKYTFLPETGARAARSVPRFHRSFFRKVRPRNARASRNFRDIMNGLAAKRKVSGRILNIGAELLSRV